MVFKLIETKQLSDIQSVAKLYHHQPTGAQVLLIQNDDINKSFTIGFPTPPESDNGIAHILEHSVLNGSENFPSKEPFVELIKGSLNTFVNAMTFGDKTVYPVASTNDKDFLNLTKVYLDAVFKPNLHNNPMILAQEGWHYHLEDPSDDLIYKGVVYNEMKGAMGSPESQLYQHIKQALYPDTIYALNSGGDPKAIPNLTQEEFTQFHKTHYHPSQSLTIAYGNFNEDDLFNLLETYFSDYEAKGTQPLTVEIPTVENAEIKETYSMTEGEDPSHLDYLALAWHTNNQDDILTHYGMRILQNVLLGDNQSPLKKALLDAGFAGAIDSGLEEVGFPIMFNITAKYTDADKMETFKQVVQETLEKLVAEGIDRDLIQAELNRDNFAMRELVISESNPRGILYSLMALSTWLYGLSPYLNLDFSDRLAELEKLADQGYFENLIQTKLLDNKHRVAITLEAEPGKNDRYEAQLHEELQAYKASLSESEIDAIVSETQSLIQRQETPDTAEDLAKIPSLDREDLSAEVEEVPLEVTELFEGTKFYSADQFTSGIDYLDLYFDVSDIETKELSLISLLTSLLGYVDTDTYPADKLQTEIKMHTGNIDTTLISLETLTGEVKVFLRVSGRALEDKLAEMLRLMRIIITESKFDSVKMIQDTVNHSISAFEDIINYSAHQLAHARASSKFHARQNVDQYILGIDYYHYLKDTNESLKDNDATIGEALAAALDKVIGKVRMHALYTGPVDRFETIRHAILAEFDHLTDNHIGQVIEYKPAESVNEGFVTSQDVNYVALAGHVAESVEHNGVVSVMRNLINFSYLWNQVRVMGGAYGVSFQQTRFGQYGFTSYRDPNIRQTIDVYKRTPEFVQNIQLDESELVTTIIGAISPLEQPKSAKDKGREAFLKEQTGVTHQMLVDYKQEILSCQVEDIHRQGAGLAESLKDYAVVVIGNKAAIDKVTSEFDVIKTL